MGLFNGITTGLNKTLSSGISGAQEKVNEKVNEEKKNITSQMNNIETQTIAADDSLKKIHKEGVMVGGRINKSQSEFLSPIVNRSQIFKQYGGKWNTKKQRHRQRQRQRQTASRK